MPDERIFITMIRELCAEKNIEFSLLSFNWICQLKKGDKVVHITGNRFDLNPEAAGHIACDKYATYCVLNSQEIPVVKHTMLFNPSTRSAYVPDSGNYALVLQEFLKNNKIVVKPNDGCEGINVFLCNSIKEAEIAIQKIFKTNPSLSICPFYNIKTEYRTFLLNGKVKLIYGKTKPFVIGDGVSTLGELINKLELPDKSVVASNLSLLNLESVPKKDEKVEVSWKFNLSGGAQPTLLEKGELYSQIEELAEKAALAMNSKFATIDVIDTEESGLMILEVNSGVCGTIFIQHIEDGYDMIKEIYSKAIDKMFE